MEPPLRVIVEVIQPSRFWFGLSARTGAAHTVLYRESAQPTCFVAVLGRGEPRLRPLPRGGARRALRLGALGQASTLSHQRGQLGLLPADWAYGYPNVWLGTTTEDEKHYWMRWPVLSKIPAARRFMSYEPAVGQLGNLAITDTLPDWIICGGESGPGARIMSPQWARELRDQCITLGVAFFHKQWEPTKAIRPSGPGLVKPTSAPTILRPTGRAARSSIGSFTGPSPEAHNPSRGTTHSDVSA
jgi:hypothetical protein